MPSPPVPAAILERVLSDRASGARGLPTAFEIGEPLPRSRIARAATIAAGLLMVAVASSLVLPHQAGAARSELRLLRAAPRPGETIPVEYRSGTSFSGDSLLKLRAAYWSARGPRQHGDVWYEEASLTRDRAGGIYEGTLLFPDSAVFGLLTVSDPDDEVVDSHGRRGWEVLAHNREGRPLFEALYARMQSLSGRNWELSFEAAKELAELYPESPQSWFSLTFYERALAGVLEADSMARAHRERLETLHWELVGDPALPVPEVGHMYALARSLGEEEIEEYWETRLLDSGARYWLGAQAVLIDRMADLYPTPGRLERSLDSLWREAGPIYHQVPRQGLAAARRLGRAGAVSKWSERLLEVVPGDRGWLGRALALDSIAAIRHLGLALVRRGGAQRGDWRDPVRSLFETAEERRQRDREAEGRSLAAIGRALMMTGDTLVAADTLAAAARRIWDLALFEQTVSAHQALGRTAEAGVYLARIVVDPSATVSRREDALRQFERMLEADAREALLGDARRLLRERIGRAETTARVPGTIRAWDSDEKEVTLGELADGRVIVVAFWSRFCGPSLAQLPDLDRLATRFDPGSVRLVAVTQEPTSGELRNFLTEMSPDLPVYHDLRSEWSQAFDQWATPEYYVLDREGVVRFRLSSLEWLPRQVDYLSRAHPDSGYEGGFSGDVSVPVLRAHGPTSPEPQRVSETRASSRPFPPGEPPWLTRRSRLADRLRTPPRP